MRRAAALPTLVVISSLCASCVRSGWEDWASTSSSNSGAARGADLNGDGCVDCADAVYFDAQLNSAQPDPAADLNGDGVVDLSDTSLLADHMGEGCEGPAMSDLDLRVEQLAAHLGKTLYGALSVIGSTGPSQEFSTPVVNATTVVTLEEALRWGHDYWLDLYLDDDDNQRCGALDLTWHKDLVVADCQVELVLLASRSGASRACGSFEVTGDITGDACVDLADFDLLEATLGQSGPDMAADLDGNGSVTTLDFAIMLQNWGYGCEATDGGMPDAAALLDAGSRDAPAEDGPSAD
jgi:hypothetical protein